MEKDNLSTRPSIRRELVKSTWNHDEKNGFWPQGFQTDEQLFCETCPLVRKQTAGNTEIG